MEEAARSFGKSDYETFLFAIGCGEVSCQQVLRKFYPSKQKEPAREKAVSGKVRARPDSGIRVQGMDDIMIRFAKCCQPVPGDRVVGVITKGRGISVHRDICQNIFKQNVPEERIVEADWDTDREQTFPVKVSLIGEDRRSLLVDIAKAISDEQANIMNVDMASRGAVVEGTFVVEVKNLRQLHSVIKAISKIRGVRGVARKGSPA